MRRAIYLIGLILLCLLPLNVMGQTQTHIVQPRETLYRIAKAYGVSVAELYKVNPSAKNGIQVGQTLVIPKRGSIPAPQVRKPIYYAVERGDTYYSIAHKNGVTVEALLAANPSLSKDNLPIGVVIVIPVPSTVRPAYSSSQTSEVPSTPQVTGLKTYLVPQDETIYNILKFTGWTEAQLYKYNPQLRSGLRAGSVILIPDQSLPHNSALPALTPQSPNATPSEPLVKLQAPLSVVLALPFSSDQSSRFVNYYEGFLLAVKEAQDRGQSIDLYVYDCSGQNLAQTLSSIKALSHVDLIIGGLSDASIEALGHLADVKGARFVIPFTSKEYTITRSSKGKVYQVNTPHDILFRSVAQRFVQEFKGDNIVFVNMLGEAPNKDSFITLLKQQLDTHHIGYASTDLPEGSMVDPNMIKTWSATNTRTIMIPSSGSLSAANKLLTPLKTAVDSLHVTNVTAFGYPEWQTYVNTLGSLFRATQSSFYSTFYVYPNDPKYQQFKSQYVYWFGHAIANTYPKYSVLGYDTGSYFFNTVRDLDDIVGSGTNYWGVQSYFDFTPDLISSNYYHNNWVVFIRFNRDGTVTKY